MPARPNKHQRQLRRWREDRESATATPADSGRKERRPLAGLPNHYEITRDGTVWSRRLKRPIKWTYDPQSGRTYIAVTVDRERHAMPVWRAVIDSWLSAAQRRALVGAVAREAIGNVSRLRGEQEKIAAVADDLGIPQDLIFRFLLSETAVKLAASAVSPAAHHVAMPEQS